MDQENIKNLETHYVKRILEQILLIRLKGSYNITLLTSINDLCMACIVQLETT